MLLRVPKLKRRGQSFGPAIAKSGKGTDNRDRENPLSHRMNTFERIGLVGLILHAIVAAYCIFPICLYIKHLQLETSNTILTQNKLAFHILILLGTLLELVYYISMYLTGEYSMWGYSCHIIGVFCGILASAMVTTNVNICYSTFYNNNSLSCILYHNKFYYHNGSQE